MSIYRTCPLKLDHVRTYPLVLRPSKVSVKDFAKPAGSKSSLRKWVDSLPRILAGNSFRSVLAALENAQRVKKPVIWGLGGHVVKCGLAPVLMDLMKRGYATAFALNGAALIHDFEVAMAGATSEDVPQGLGKGRFGMAEETSRYIHQAVAEGDRESLGLGEAVGRFLSQFRGARFRRSSLLAAAYARRIPVTVHEAIGADIIYNHPAVDARALGGASFRDFLLLAALVRDMDGGGVYLNVGSAVILPEVFLKCFSLVANLHGAPRGITTVNLDFIQHYRPLQNVVRRPAGVAKKGRNASQGFALTGHHELMIPLIAAALAR
jgi:hypothetical protein